MRPPGRRSQPVADGGSSAFDLAQPEAQGSDPTFGSGGRGDDERKAVSTLSSFELALNEGATLVIAVRGRHRRDGGDVGICGRLADQWEVGQFKGPQYRGARPELGHPQGWLECGEFEPAHRSWKYPGTR